MEEQGDHVIVAKRKIKVERPLEDVKKEYPELVEDFEKENVQNRSPSFSSRRRKHVKVEYDIEEKAVVPKKRSPHKKMKLEEWNHPTEQECRTIHKILCDTHGKPYQKNSNTDSLNACGKKKDILYAAVGVILSQNTSNTNSSRALASLKKAYPNLEDMRKAPVENIEEAIRSGGLAKIKSKRISELLQAVHDDFGVTSLEHLRDKPTEEVKAALSKYKGMGPKTVSCVLLFTLGRNDFPVDTHVHRVSTRLGWVPTSGGSREKTYERLNEKIPDDLKYDLHVLLIRHGRAICQSQIPKCASCPVNSLCAYDEKTTTVMKVEKVSLEDLIE